MGTKRRQLKRRGRHSRTLAHPQTSGVAGGKACVGAARAAGTVSLSRASPLLVGRDLREELLHRFLVLDFGQFAFEILYGQVMGQDVALATYDFRHVLTGPHDYL
jgi:hypothetical protein